MLQLKNYQEAALQKLAAFLGSARLDGNCSRAFAKEQDAQGYGKNYKGIKGLEDVPYICLRLPTGGGKTLLGSYAIGKAAEEFLEQDYPMVVWLVPTDIIRKQTLEVLQSCRKENRRVLDERFNGNVRVYDITDFTHLRPQDLRDKTNVFIATFAAFRVKSKDGRKVYQTNEALDPCFRDIPEQEYFDKDEQGAALHSFANLLSFMRPCVIIDEAHNHASKLSEEVLRRLRPAVIVELTATPADNSNVLYKVTASELKAEDMIKLPIMLEEAQSWQGAIDSGIERRKGLEKLAENEPQYVRPIMLIQAENKDREVTVEVVRDYLINEHDIPEEQVAVVTGEQRELDDVDLFDPDCPVRYVITVQALKEGWDCSFAYVFCSVAKVHSSKDAEQLLGRVLRMPYARRRAHEALNRAYAHVAVDSWMSAVGSFKDNLIDMGFEREETEEAVQSPQQLDLLRDDEKQEQAERATLEFFTEEVPDFSTNMALRLLSNVVKDENTGKYKVTIKDADEENLRELSEQVEECFNSPHDRQEVLYAVSRANVYIPPKGMADKGVTFTVPQLCLDFGDGAELADRETCLPDGWRISVFPADLPAFAVDESRHVYEFDIMDGKITEQFTGTEEGSLGLERLTDWDEKKLVIWLSRRINALDLEYGDLINYLRKVIDYQVNNKKVPMADLVRFRFVLVKIIKAQIEANRKEAYKQGVQETLFTSNVARVTPTVQMAFRPGHYPAKSFYRGKVKFQKHFYATIGELDSKDEVMCAQYIDANPKVETWVRNIPRDMTNSFWLPTHEDNFYPDFVVKLKDGRVAAIEVKGGHLVTNEDSREKDMIGRVWADASDGKCLFLMATLKNEQGLDMGRQINELLS
ncbi:MAG: restriction endonuclease subunit R [Selenomonas ruminantium]|uniref:Restriction endonuclease subunit R n=1 Tax=Selenomonas ruminantium TaxID=971 RepID=A0A927WH17_SELRU|nr:DEAD/DEAH box helicase family protein [Selenomonas ruminantium]MBE6084256.1 restriction endonuclease subunit R [Selenomonas ruminantium]